MEWGQGRGRQHRRVVPSGSCRGQGPGCSLLFRAGGPGAPSTTRVTRALFCLPLRKCKLVTSGPWLEVTSVALRDVSIIPESPSAQGSGPNIALWAVSDKGDVLCRLGVSELNPEVGTPWGNPGPAQPAAPSGLGRILTETWLRRGVGLGSGLPGPDQDGPWARRTPHVARGGLHACGHLELRSRLA